MPASVGASRRHVWLNAQHAPAGLGMHLRTCLWKRRHTDSSQNTQAGRLESAGDGMCSRRRAHRSPFTHHAPRCMWDGLNPLPHSWASFHRHSRGRKHNDLWLETNKHVSALSGHTSTRNTGPNASTNTTESYANARSRTTLAKASSVCSTTWPYRPSA
eukprot:6878218-Prymnesium_polylepis.1